MKALLFFLAVIAAPTPVRRVYVNEARLMVEIGGGDQPGWLVIKLNRPMDALQMKACAMGPADVIVTSTALPTVTLGSDGLWHIEFRP